MLVRTFASAVIGIDAEIVTIEVNVSRGIRFLVGLPGILLSRKVSRGLNRRSGRWVSLVRQAGAYKYGTCRYQEGGIVL